MRVATTTTRGPVATSRSRYTRSGPIGTRSNKTWTREPGPLTRAVATAKAPYGWVGAKQRSNDDLAGLALMGVRLYNPATGRFLTVDPVVGGNANSYTYPADPINGSDPSGQVCLVSCIWDGIKAGAEGAWHMTKSAFKQLVNFVRTHPNTARSVVVGSLLAASCGATIACAVFAGAAAGVDKYISSQRDNGKAVTPDGIVRAGVKGAVTGGAKSAGKKKVGGVISKSLKGLVKKKK